MSDIEFEVIQKIKVKPISEEFIRRVVIAEIQKQIPQAKINGIEFITKRNPTRIEVEVDAEYATGAVSMNTPTPRKTTPLTDTALEDNSNTSVLGASDGTLGDSKKELLDDILDDSDDKKTESEVSKDTDGNDVADMFKV